MKKLIFTFLILASFVSMQAQDRIYVNPREIGREMPPGPRRMPPKPSRLGAIRENHPTARILMCKVTEITPAFVFYTKESDASGTLYTTPLDVLDSIVFENGDVQRFTKEARMPEHKLRERREYANLGTNIITGFAGVFTHRIEFLSNEADPDFTPFAQAGFAYEKLYLKDRLGVEIAPFVGLNKKAYGGVLQAKFYPKNYGRFRIGLGPFYTLYVRDKSDRYSHTTDLYSMSYERQVAMSVLGFGAQMQSHIDRNWLISFNFSVGGVIGYTDRYKSFPGFNKSMERGMGHGSLRLGLGYRF